MFLPMLSKLIAAVFNRPFTRRYPFEKPIVAAKHRGHIGIEIEKCIYCFLCVKKCPTDALVVDKKERFWEIRRLSCVTCNACVEVCPKKCLHMDESWSESVNSHTGERYFGPPASPKPAPSEPTT